MKTYVDLVALWLINFFVQIAPTKEPIMQIGETPLVWLTTIYTVIKIIISVKKFLTELKDRKSKS